MLQLADVADRISLGELNAEIRVNRRDEVDDPAEALRRMRVSLQTAIERLRARRNTWPASTTLPTKDAAP